MTRVFAIAKIMVRHHFEEFTIQYTLFKMIIHHQNINILKLHVKIKELIWIMLQILQIIHGATVLGVKTTSVHRTMVLWLNLVFHSIFVYCLQQWQHKNRVKFRHVKRDIHHISNFQLCYKRNEHMVNEEDNNQAKEARNTW